MSPTTTTQSNTAAAGGIQYVASCLLPTPWATFQMHGFQEQPAGKEHVALTLGDISDGQPVLARVHSECLTGDALFSQRCDCGAQLKEAMAMIAKEGRGMILYLRQEGRGIGLLNKIQAYNLQDEGADTVEANRLLGFADDLRDYSLCRPMLEHFKVSRLRLMTNNPRKVDALTRLGISVDERLELIVNRNPFNDRYLDTKATRLGHLIPAGRELG